MNIQIEIQDRDFQRVAIQFGELAEGIPLREMQKIARKASRPLILAARKAAPKSNEPTKVYDTPKVLNNLRAPKGRGRVKATIMPGNLARSIRNLPLRKAYGVVVGPRRSRTLSGIYGSARRSSGYYGAFVARGTRNLRKTTNYMQQGLQSSRQAVTQLLESGIAEYLNDKT